MIPCFRILLFTLRSWPHRWPSLDYQSTHKQNPRTTMHIAIQGIEGSFHHAAAEQHFDGERLHLRQCMSFRELSQALAKGEVEAGVMAIENSIAGTILPNYSLIHNFNLQITGEIYLPIQHLLLALPGQRIEAIREVRSHPMALLQCEDWFSQYPHIRLVEDVDTAYVAQQIAKEEQEGIAAIASHTAAQVFGLQILSDAIQTIKSNYTRFFVLHRPEKAALMAPDEPVQMLSKVSLKIIAAHEQGSLARILGLIADAQLNMTKIQSVPIIDQPWRYSFYIDLLVPAAQNFQATLAKIEAVCHELKVLGHYPAGKHAPVLPRQNTKEA